MAPARDASTPEMTFTALLEVSFTALLSDGMTARWHAPTAHPLRTPLRTHYSTLFNSTVLYDACSLECRPRHRALTIIEMDASSFFRDRQPLSPLVAWQGTTGETNTKRRIWSCQTLAPSSLASQYLDSGKSKKRPTRRMLFPESRLTSCQTCRYPRTPSQRLQWLHCSHMSMSMSMSISMSMSMSMSMNMNMNMNM